jgi:hypothetical protein
MSHPPFTAGLFSTSVEDLKEQDKIDFRLTIV